MQAAVRAIIINDDTLLVMHRNKFGTEYDTLIGGAVEMGESFEQAILREIQEETGVQVQNPRPVFIDRAGEPYGTQYIFLCDYVSGEPVLSAAAPETTINAMGQNLYQPKWLPLAELANAPFKSEATKRAILFGAEHGFPEESVDITGKTTYTSW